MGRLKKIEAAVFRRVRREPPRGFVHRTAFWLLVGYLVLALFGWLPGSVGVGFSDAAEIVFLVLIVFSIPLLWRFVFGYLLWKVRNRLILTYLLMGLTPLVLFATLTVLLLYVFSGQFAMFAANSVLGDELTHISTVNASLTERVSSQVGRGALPAAIALPEALPGAEGREPEGVAVYVDGRLMPVTPASLQAQPAPSVPAWLPKDFRGIVLDGGRLWLRAANREKAGAHRIVVITSVPLQKESVAAIARNLGRVSIFPGIKFDDRGDTQFRISGANSSGSDLEINGQNVEQLRRNAIVAGVLPPAQHFYDVEVRLDEPLDAVDWATGKQFGIAANVESRPSLLYRVLFSASLNIGTLVRDALITMAVVFGVLELLAFLAAVRLNQTITRSVHGLYEGTLAIDSGQFGHRIPVKRKDQLGALSRSFNDMAASLERLMAEQREKQRLQNELAIAQEVQANLFPRGHMELPMLELHGVCVPARTVSGDYYDFLMFGETGLGLALGDISGKGISAALLMATLHSAVRAYRFAGEELVSAGTAALAIRRTRESGEHELECGELFEEPAKILALLNRHLYRSTQPEKYATLFLAHYDGLSRRLVYSNGGHLPPLLLRADDTVTRLERGGMVVGLLDGMDWEQGAERLSEGDILILYSDGVTEPENEFGEFGEERLLELVRRHKHLPLEAIADRVMQDLRSWIGDQEQPDDITLVLARQR